MRKSILLLSVLAVSALFLLGCTFLQTSAPAVSSPKTICVFTGEYSASYQSYVTKKQLIEGNNSAGYSYLFDIVAKQGHNVTVTNKIPANLSQCDAVVVFSGYSQYTLTGADMVALADYVGSGKKMLIVMEGADYILLSKFSINTGSIGASSPILSVNSDHQIAKNVTKVVIFGADGLEGGESIVARGGKSVVAINRFQDGEIMSALSQTFHNEYIIKFDNAKLAANIAKWLVNDSTVPNYSFEYPEPKDEIIDYFLSTAIGDAVRWLAKEDPGSTVAAWWDYGLAMEEVGLKPVIKRASQKILATIAMAGSIPPEDVYDIYSQLGYKFESDERTKDIADLIVGGQNPTAIMKKYGAKYLMLDGDLVGKWGSLSFSLCLYKNETTLSTMGNSDCELVYYPEMLFVAQQPTIRDLCDVGGNNQSLRAYSSMSKHYDLQYYCLSSDFSSKQSDYAGVYPASFAYANGTMAGISGFTMQGMTQEGYLILNAIYPSNSTDKKGYYYDSTFYKGFYEGSIPGFIQVYPTTNDSNTTVKIFKLVD
jgi:hypothetical protein